MSARRTRRLAFLSLLTPHCFLLFLGRVLGWIWYYLIPIRRSLVRRHIRHALDPASPAETRSIARRMFENLGMNLVELFLIDPANPQKTLGRIERRNMERFDREYAKGKGVLVLTAHFGNWDLLCCSQAMAGIPITIISKTIKPRWLNDYWMRTRRQCGVEILPDRGVRADLLKRLDGGGVVGFVIDQHAPGGFGVVVDFFGRPAYTTPGLAELALDSGAPVVPIFLVRCPGGHHRMEVGRPIPIIHGTTRHETVCKTTQAYNRALEEAVRLHPDHWLWLHRRWKVATEPGEPAFGPPNGVKRLNNSDFLLAFFRSTRYQFALELR